MTPASRDLVKTILARRELLVSQREYRRLLREMLDDIEQRDFWLWFDAATDWQRTSLQPVHKSACPIRCECFFCRRQRGTA